MSIQVVTVNLLPHASERTRRTIREYGNRFIVLATNTWNMNRPTIYVRDMLSVNVPQGMRIERAWQGHLPVEELEVEFSSLEATYDE